VPGKWVFTLVFEKGGMGGPLVEVDLNLSQSGDTISSDSDNTVDNETCGGAHVTPPSEPSTALSLIW